MRYSSKTFQQTSTQSEVFFIVNIKELFNIDLKFSGIKTALNTAFMDSRQYCPYKTGLMRSSYTIKELNEYMVKVFFDPKKIIGKTRNGVKVKEYYPAYLMQYPKTYNFLDIMMKHFYDRLFSEVKQLKKKSETKEDKTEKIELLTFLAFMDSFKMQYKAKKDEAKELQKEQKEKQKLKEEERKRRIKNVSLKDKKEG